LFVAGRSRYSHSVRHSASGMSGLGFGFTDLLGISGASTT
jgi:hypothetical protein